MRRPSAALRSAKLSTSPLSAATTYGPAPGRPPRRVERVGVGLGDDADAGPAGVAEHDGLRLGAGERRAAGASSRRMAARSAAVLSPSSPISAAAL